MTDHLTLGGQTFVRIANGVASYPLNDHLGTAYMVATSNGSIAAATTYNYTPFGETIGGGPGSKNEQGFTGHVEDETGLTYMQARYYDPVIGRFLSVDPIGYGDQLNLFAYVHNDPVNKFDPNGMVSTGTVQAFRFHVAYNAISNGEIDKAGLSVSTLRTVSDAASYISLGGLFGSAVGVVSGNPVLIAAGADLSFKAGAISATTGMAADLIELNTVNPDTAQNAIPMVAGKVAERTLRAVKIPTPLAESLAGSTEKALKARNTIAASVSTGVEGGGTLINTASGVASDASAAESRSAKGLSSGNFRVCSGTGAQSGGCQ